MRIKGTIFNTKFKQKIPCSDEKKLASLLSYNLNFLGEIDEKIVNKNLEELESQRKEFEESFNSLHENFSELLGESAKIRFRANEKYDNNRVIALTTGLLKQKLSYMKRDDIDLPLDYDEAIKFLEYFIYRYITKKQDKRLVEQIPFSDLG